MIQKSKQLGNVGINSIIVVICLITVVISLINGNNEPPKNDEQTQGIALLTIDTESDICVTEYTLGEELMRYKDVDGNDVVVPMERFNNLKLQNCSG